MLGLRILFINSIQMWGGGEVFLLDVMHGLQNRGHQVTLVCRPATILEKNAKSEGFEVIPIKMRGDFDPIVIWKIARILRQKNIQIVSTNMDKELRFGGIAARLGKIKAVIPSREVDCPLKNKLRYRFSYNFLADYIIANSVSTKSTLLKSAPWLKSDRIEVVYKGIDPSPYVNHPEQGMASRQELGLTPDESLVGFVGQIVERKGIPDIIESIPVVLHQLPDAKFLFVGEGNLKHYLLDKIKEFDLDKQVIYAGFRKDIPAIMKAIDVLVLPSIVEGFGYVLVEAMAAAKPVVATNVSSIPEIVKHGETGLLVNVHRPDELAQSIITLLHDREMAQSMGEKGRQRVLEHFTYDKMLSHIEAIFLEKVYGLG